MAVPCLAHGVLAVPGERMVPAPKQCAFLGTYFSLNSCICIRKFPYVSLFFFGRIGRPVVKKKKKLPSFAPKEI